jgi:hypothetical protein
MDRQTGRFVQDQEPCPFPEYRKWRPIRFFCRRRFRRKKAFIGDLYHRACAYPAGGLSSNAVYQDTSLSQKAVDGGQGHVRQTFTQYPVQAAAVIIGGGGEGY